MTTNFEKAAKEAEHYYGVILTDIPEDDRLDHWPWSQKYLDEINADMARGCFDSMLQMLDQIGVPKGTYSDDRLQNFIVMYNNRGDVMEALQKQVDATIKDDEITALRDHIKTLNRVLVEIANWNVDEENTIARKLQLIASTVISPNDAPMMKSLTTPR